MSADAFEPRDAARPFASVLRGEQAAALPLVAFAVLEGGDVFERGTNAAVSDAAQRYVDTCVTLDLHGASATAGERVLREMTQVLRGNPSLSGRMCAAKPVHVDVVPPRADLRKLGFPASAADEVAGLFWDEPDWARARIVLRQEHLDGERTVVFHETAHAVHYLAFTSAERDVIYRTLRPTYGSRSAMDEVFAIYSERELGGVPFTKPELETPGIYGAARRAWSEDHIFTRFVRKLYHPNVAAAGPGMRSSTSSWMKGLGRRAR